LLSSFSKQTTLFQHGGQSVDAPLPDPEPPPLLETPPLLDADPPSGSPPQSQLPYPDPSLLQT
jgi:hypothetical protein